MSEPNVTFNGRQLGPKAAWLVILWIFSAFCVGNGVVLLAVLRAVL